LEEQVMAILKTGIRAYYDTFAGLVPVDVLSVTAPAEKPLFDLAHGGARASIVVKCRVSDDHGPYRKGTNIESNSLYVVPRAAIRRLQYSQVIAPYRVQAD
jgi:hypothetical protein